MIRRPCYSAHLQDASSSINPAPLRSTPRLKDWRSLFTGDVAQARQGFRELLTTPIRFTPFVHQGMLAVRFEGRGGLEAVFGGVVTKMASPTGFDSI